jgi:4-diphosphocytidyl-2-C-methyl-D-erythritol kinase
VRVAGASWPAPAKLNLFIHVVGRREDGYHEIQSAIQFLDFGDRLYIDTRPDKRVVRPSGPAEVAQDEDLATRAARALQIAAGVATGAEIHVEKRIPMQAGLGGGSSDAATVLVALNRLWGLDLSPSELARIGLTLGADVPVFVHGRAAWVEGIGERLGPVSLPEPWYAVVRPPVTVSTAEIYGAPELTRNSPRITISDFASGAGGNDFEPVVRARYPAVARILDWLGGFGPARLTGTGACVFAAFDDEAAARDVIARLPTGCEGFIARGRNRSPLLDRLEHESTTA